METVEDIEIYSESVRDFLERIPSWLIRWGISVVFLIVVALLGLSYIIHYPEMVVAPLKLTSIDAPKPIIARTDGKLMKLLVFDNQKVTKGKVLGYIESTADYQAVLEVEKSGESSGNLGELQPAYQIFDQAQTQYFAFKRQGFYDKRKTLLQKDLVDLQRLATNLEEQKVIQQEDFKISENEYQVQKKLAEQKVIAPLELKREESKFIAKKLPLKNLESSLINNSTAQTAKTKELMDLEKTISEQENLYQQAKNTFKSALDAWKQQYILTASADGVLSFSSLIQEKMQMAVNQELFNISSNHEEVLGTIQIPQENFGKVKEGQTVLIKFNSYPFQEFGAVKGQISMISLIPNPQQETYMAKIIFPNGLKTNYNKQITYRNGMKATAEIITEDMRLIERLLYNFRKAVSR
jgi:multidrug efflux pump subunit AcrA (membrane-fusion protein)